MGVVSAMDIISNELKVGHEVVSEHEFYLRSDLESRGELERMGVHVEDYADAQVREIMTPLIISAPPEATVPQLANLMGTNKIHRVLIAEGEKLVGVVTALDLIGLVAASQGLPVGVFDSRATRRIVLWATDLGADAERVGRRAVQLARRIGATLTILHVTPDLAALWALYGQRPEVEDLQKNLEDQALGRLHDLLKLLEPRVDHVDLIGRTGDPATVILTVAADLSPDYIILGAERPASERLKGLGSVAEKVLVSAVSPVVTVPKDV